MAAPNPHPDQKLFAQLHRLLAVYSLISPAKKSNVSGVGNVQALMKANDDVRKERLDRQQEFDDLFDKILESGKN
ncbi:Myocardin [Frankliniella fusca]|uniref:Myocardin n=1 Tax=Frankliniella fusca TaxID=407009 RepID=A0AAE1GXH3_9NEOP|nr:Myocardin [Frankliniella fusca]